MVCFNTEKLLEYASRYCAVALLVFCKDQANAFMPFTGKSRSHFYWGGGGGGLIRRGTASSLRVRLLSLLHLFNVCG